MDERKPILVLYLEDITLSPGMRMRLGSLQALYRFRHKTEESFIQALADARILQPCLNSAVSEPTPEIVPEIMPEPVAEPIPDTLPESDKAPDMEKDPTETAVTPEDAYKNGRAAYNAQQYEEAARWYTIAAEGGHVEAMRQLAYCYSYGRGVATDYSLCVRWFRAAAELGDADSMKELAWRYEIGSGMKMDKEAAVLWYRRAAEKGHTVAMGYLASCYEKGSGVAKDLNEAIRWHRKAAAAGYSYSRDRLKALGFDPSPAACFEKGKRLYDAKEYAEAVEFFRIAAQQGHTDAQYYLGNCYYTGKGVDKDPAEAANWYRKAAGQGHPAAQYALGFCYAHGAGVKQSHSMALMWYKKAAEAGHTAAINSVAWHYAYGGAAGVKRNKEEAIRLFLINANKGDQYAIRQLRELGYKI